MNIKFEARGNGVVTIYEDGITCGTIMVSDDQEFVRIMTGRIEKVEVNMVAETISGEVTGIKIDHLG